MSGDGDATVQSWFVLYLDAKGEHGQWHSAGLWRGDDEDAVLAKVFDQGDKKGVSGIKYAVKIRIIEADSGKAFAPSWGPV